MAPAVRNRRVGSPPPINSEHWYGLLARSSFLFTLSLLLNSHTILGGFVFDDNEAIVSNPDVRSHVTFTSVFANDFWGYPISDPESHKSYRPLTTLSFRLNYWMHGLSPGGYHGVNVLVHSIVCVLVHYVLMVAGVRRNVSWLTALLFTVHPIHTEAVANVVGRAELLSALFFFLSFLSYLISIKTDGGTYTWRITAVSLAGVSMLCKEQGITVLAVCIFYELLLKSRRIWLHLRGALKLTGGIYYLYNNIILFTLSLGLALLARLLISQGRPAFVYSDNPTSFSDSILIRTLTYSHLTSLNVWLLMCPSLLCFDWSMGSIVLVKTLNDYRNIGSVTLFAFLIIIIIKNVVEFFRPPKVSQTTTRVSSHNRSSLSTLISTLWPGEKNNSFACLLGLSLLIIPYIPASNLFFPVGFVLAERVLYLPSVGYCLLVSHGFYAINERLRRGAKRPTPEAILSKPLMTLFILILLMFSAKTLIRNWEWGDTERLAVSGLKVNPLNAKVHFAMGNVLAQQGNRSCEKYYRQALELKPDYILALTNLGLVLLNTGRAKEAEECYKRALSIKPDHITANINMGHLCRLQERWGEALEHYNRAKERRPHSSVMHYYAGWMLSETGKEEEAKRELTAAIEMHKRVGKGEYGDAHLLLGRLLASEGSKPTSVRRLKGYPVELQILIHTLFEVVYGA
ncbi:PREDICTED: transmembrane and TPR repeat-containing protein 4-like isoform X2 [Amphimedon queenslandica]|uniref:dolichyl-phosphate-mannose--protein mannosyltransferase n=1 Tax=Amphimedon queenslandica TaxID=400682 RepID=A0AAN0JBD2_AMPQE|nr:PREDICTED: transmembrane and TPR repeat-containing protein 4-like isoform X2 [Amphimedon queenslandica]|eukprot:XP_019854061.1 PREDICTED: transmembrane and TPR repeat-containing protein 4-like isoform X2 [Amphimedon queenslandica]